MINKKVNLSSGSSALEASLTHRTPQSSANWPFSTCQEMPGCSHMPGRAAASLIQTHRFWKPFSSAGQKWPAPGWLARDRSRDCFSHQCLSRTTRQQSVCEAKATVTRSFAPSTFPVNPIGVQNECACVCCTHRFVSIHVLMCTYSWACFCAHVWCVSTYVWVCVCAWMFVYTCMHVHVSMWYLSISVHIRVACVYTGKDCAM